MSIEVASVDSPLGPIHVAARAGVLWALSFDDYWDHEQQRLHRRAAGEALVRARCAATVSALERYFAGDLEAIADLPADPGGTPFQARVWRALRDIPAGRTWSYRALAAAIGEPAAIRAVGAANGRNPIPIVIPCHRAVGADGGLVGYGGGLERKAWLLRHEGAVL
jgi:methylated-DNA-[protein]-cysteine S-methyltransferase